MEEDLLFVITISRQLGSGGAYLGQRLANRLNILYFDREILSRAAEKLKISETDLHNRDERLTPRWQSWLGALSPGYSQAYEPPTIPEEDIPNDKMLFEAQSDIIRRISQERSAVVVGRAASYVLRQVPRHLSVLIYADAAFRQKRVRELYHVSEQDALKLINRVDWQRTQYSRAFTGQYWLNACQYHLCLDTSVIGFEKAEDIILAALQGSLGIIVSQEEKSGSK